MELDDIIKDLYPEDSEFNRKCFFISEKITSGSLPFVNLIEKLDFLLTSTSPEKRYLGVNILTEVLGKMPADLLNLQQVEATSTFFISRLKDHHQVVPTAIKGLIFIVQLKNYPLDHVPVLLTTMVDNIACQQQQQGDRYNIYRLFELILENFSKEILLMGLNFTYGIITSIDGERDPRNLLFLFKLMNKYLKIIPLGHLVEDMFDVLACYFPVDFKTPFNNAVVTRENLSEGLCPCLCAVPEFGELCIELALDKLDSSLEIAKTDSLELLKEGCKNFNAKTYLDNSYKIWSQLQKEIFTSTEVKLQQQCLETLTLVVNKMSQGGEAEFKKFVHDVMDTLKGNLLPEMKQYQASILILLHIARGSQICSSLIIAEIAPIIINTFSIAPVQYKPVILKALVNLTKTHLTQIQNLESIKLLDNVVSVCFQSMFDSNEALRREIFDSFSLLAPYLTEDIRKLLYKAVSTHLVTIENNSVRVAFNNCLLQLCKHYQNEMEEVILKVTTGGDSVSIDIYLTSLCTLITLDNLRKIIANIFVKYISENIESACIAIRILNWLLEKEQNKPEYLLVFLEKNLIGILMEFCITHLSDINVHKILQDVSSLIKILIGCQDSLTQKIILDHWLSQLSNGIERHESFVLLLDGLVSRLNRDVEIDCDLTHKLFKIAVSGQEDRNKKTAEQLLANIINKKDIDDEFEEHLQALKSKCEQHLVSNSNNVLMTVSWITKALVTRNYPDGMNWLSLLLNSIDNNLQASEAFKTIMDDNYDCLGPKSKSIKTALYQQKVFIYVVNKLLSDISQITKPEYLRTFGYVVGYAPKEVIMMYFKKISKLVLLSLELSNAEILLILLTIIKNIVLSNKNEIEEHLEDYVNRVLNLMQFQGSMKVRVAAVQFITILLSTYPIYKLLPLRKAVLEHLGQSVDDEKRLVRKEAMEARSLWFLLDSPTE